MGPWDLDDTVLSSLGIEFRRWLSMVAFLFTSYPWYGAGRKLGKQIGWPACFNGVTSLCLFALHTHTTK